jgi:hypothetical protein
MAYQIAEVYGVRGDVNRAFEWLERAWRQKDGGLVSTKTDPDLRSLHGDPRWHPFLKKIGSGTRPYPSDDRRRPGRPLP